MGGGMRLYPYPYAPNGYPRLGGPVKHDACLSPFISSESV